MSFNKIFQLVVGLFCVGLASFMWYKTTTNDYTFSFNRRVLKIIVFYLLGFFQLYKAFFEKEGKKKEGDSK